MAAWDPDDLNTRPTWHANETLTLLRGMEFEREDVRVAKGKRSDAIYTLETIRFQCGCVASDDKGWRSCGHGIHRVLADTLRGSPLVRLYVELRSIFDDLLSEAWKRYGRSADSYIEFHKDRQRIPFLEFGWWQQNHDLLGQHIWTNGLLRADLQHLPLEKNIVIFNSGISPHVTLSLQVRGDRLEPQSLAPPRINAMHAVFGEE